jgi:hypothetical protein
MGTADRVVFLTEWWEGAGEISSDVRTKLQTITDDFASGIITINLN